MNSKLLVLLVALIAVCAIAPAANAQDGCGMYGGGLYGWGYNYGALYNSLFYRVPYYAAYPPVYYSQPVPRTYGYSPFAYPPYVRTPDVVVEPEPQTIINPYVPSSRETQSKPVDQLTQRTQPKPLVIINPYVTPVEQVARTER